MIPVELHEVFKTCICLKFQEEPPYDELLECLQVCFEKAVNAR